uniref:cation:dicarboxylate symporter family transporter n=1 Tax=Mesorhizobium mediterraneum TaxID=43617 RepID=UPI0017826438
ALFIAQATNTDLSIGGRILLLLVGMLPSKGATRITGEGFVTLAATLFIVPTAPAAGMTLILGVDQFMSEYRALTTFVGNAVSSLVMARSSRMKDDWLRPSPADLLRFGDRGSSLRAGRTALAAGQLARTLLSYSGRIIGAKPS